jgi:hypothetical protein
LAGSNRQGSAKRGRKFGERYFAESDFERIPETAAKADEHPILALPDDVMVRGRQNEVEALASRIPSRNPSA